MKRSGNLLNNISLTRQITTKSIQITKQSYQTSILFYFDRANIVYRKLWESDQFNGFPAIGDIGAREQRRRLIKYKCSCRQEAGGFFNVMMDKYIDPFYKSKRWEKKRALILRRDGYMCQHFKRYGKAIQADMVHHIFPREDYPEYEWESWNLISLSNKAHNMMHDRDSHELTALGKDLMMRTARKQGIQI